MIVVRLSSLRRAELHNEWSKIREGHARWDTSNINAKAVIIHQGEEKAGEMIKDEQKARSYYLVHFAVFVLGLWIYFRAYCSSRNNENMVSLRSCGNSPNSFAMTMRAKAKDAKKLNVPLLVWVIVSLLLKNLNRESSLRSSAATKSAENQESIYKSRRKVHLRSVRYAY